MKRGKGPYIAGRDLMTIFSAMMIAFVVNMAPKKPKADEAAIKSPGSIAVYVSWPTGDTDVDLWVKSPDDQQGVGYSNKAGEGFALLRDDLGDQGDKAPANFENAFTRSLSPGEYIINLHGYRLREGPVTVNWEVTIARPGQKPETYRQGDVALAMGQERTIIRFRVDDKGRATGDSTVFYPLREGKKP